MYIIVANYIDIRNQDFSPHYNSTAGTAQLGRQITVIGPNVSVFVLVKIANCPSHCWEGSLAIKIPLQVSGGALLEYLAVVQDEELHHISLNITPLHYIAQNHQVYGH